MSSKKYDLHAHLLKFMERSHESAKGPRGVKGRAGEASDRDSQHSQEASIQARKKGWQ